MALAYPHVVLFYNLRKAGLIGGDKTHSIMEFGEQNWFGDVNTQEITAMIDEFADAEASAHDLKQELNSLCAQNQSGAKLFDIAKCFYKVVTEYQTYSAVDLHGTDAACAFDLNAPLPIEDQFDLVTNLGTAEHVFNQSQFFRSMHEKTKPGGLMVHALPNQGCFDHGFYNYHPTFVFDLCRENGYDVLNLSYVDGTQHPSAIISIDERATYVKMAVEKQLSDYSGLLAVLRKGNTQSEFKAPVQGYYDDALPADLARAWSELPR